MPERNDNAESVLNKYGIHYPRCGAWFSPGWTHIVDKLIEDLIAIGWDKGLAQVKEKFGGLRFYIDCGDEKMFELIHAAESLSLRTCEECGAIGENRAWIRGWYATLCPPCGKKYVAKHKREDEQHE